MSTEKITAKDFLKQLTKGYDNELKTANERGQLVAWSSALFPQEFLTAMDVVVGFPENHTAGIAARGKALPFIEYADKIGFTPDICSYARINAVECMMINDDCPDASDELKEAIAGMVPLPKPDFLVTATNSCFALPKWFEWVADYFNVPLFVLEVPFNLEYDPKDNSVEYVKNQLIDMVAFMEDVCGRPFDYENFVKRMETSIKNCALWEKTTEYSEMTPSAIDGFRLFNYLAIIGMQRCRETTTEFFELLHEEIEESIREGKLLYNGEQKHRIMWEGIACWPHLSFTAKYLKANDIIFATSRYYKSWCMHYNLHDIESIARAVCLILSDCNLERNLDVRKQLAANSNVAGVISHSNKSCRIFALTQKSLVNKVHEETGLPISSFDGDQADPRDFSSAQYETRIQALVETMTANAAAGEASK